MMVMMMMMMMMTGWIKTNNSLRFYHSPQMRHTYVCPLHMINCSSLLMSFCPVFIAMMPSYVLLR